MSVVERETRRWTVAEYDQLVQLGVFGADERLELIEGEIHRMSPQLSRHATVVGLVGDLLIEIFRSGHCVRIQMPLRAGEASEPEPDVAVVRGARRDYLQQHPSEAVLVVEVSETSAAFDLINKAAVYARGGFEEYWVVVLPERALIIHRNPDTASGEYRSVTRYDERATVTPLQAPAGEIRIADLLP